MRNLGAETYRVWRPDLLDIARLAVTQKSPVVINCHMSLDKCNTADVSLLGRFIDVTGHQAQFIVDIFDLELARNFPRWPECDYNFIVDLPRGKGEGRMEYGGRALIQDYELYRNDLPIGLLLRLATPTRARQLRRHERHRAPDKMAGMPGLMLIDKAPSSKRQLLALLTKYYKRATNMLPQLVDISAGGVCLQSADPRCQRFMGAEESYLFFFFPEPTAQPVCPHVFVGKKVGLLRGESSRHAGLRIKFLRELVWNEPEDELKWIELGPEGSATLKKMIEEWNRAHPDTIQGSDEHSPWQ